MIVYYRLCNIASSNPSPVLQDDKYALNKLCLKSFVLAFREVKPKIIFIADYCGREYEEMIKEVVPFEYEIHFTALGINGTALLQYEMAKKQKTDGVILFAETDYVWRPSVGKTFVEAVQKYGLVSPFDHPDLYTRYDIHEKLHEIDIVSNTHFRTATRNTMTFAMTHKAFIENYEILKHHGYLDGPVWLDMKNNGQKLWTPIPGMAVHMVDGLLSPAVPWETVWNIFK